LIKPLIAETCLETSSQHKKDLSGIVPHSFDSHNRAWEREYIMDKVLVLSENEDTSRLLGVILQREHFFPILTDSEEMALQNICTLDPDVLLIDLPFGGIPLLDLCAQLHPSEDKLMIILGDSSEEIDKVLALEAGADDYIVKPFARRELIARVRAVLRRRRTNLSPVIRFGNVEVDRQRRTVVCQGQEVRMTPCEYRLLLFFLRNVDLALTRQTLLSSVWGYSEDANTRTLDAHVNKLRKKCETDPNTPRHIVTVHGVGYRFLM
jgi:DNA-binding response OmpR family regulator